MPADTETRWSCTRAQMIDALAGIRVEGVKMSGPLARMVLADDMADAILAQLEPVRTSVYWGVGFDADPSGTPFSVESYDDREDALEHLDSYHDGFLVSQVRTHRPWLRAAAGEQE